MTELLNYTEALLNHYEEHYFEQEENHHVYGLNGEIVE